MPSARTAPRTPLRADRQADRHAHRLPHRRAGRRLLELVDARLEPDETIEAWCRVWYSRPARIQWSAPRFRDFVVLTDRRLVMYSARWLTRMPHRRILADHLESITATPLGRRSRAIRIDHPGHPPMLLEFGSDGPSTRIIRRLLQPPATPPTTETIGDHAWPS